MFGISPKLPLTRDSVDGAYALNKNYVEMVKQNFRMLMLTSPGERVMIPDFGVGLRRVLFENNTRELKEIIAERVLSQTKKYMPFLAISGINFEGEENELKISISYIITPLSVADVLQITK